MPPPSSSCIPCRYLSDMPAPLAPLCRRPFSPPPPPLRVPPSHASSLSRVIPVPCLLALLLALIPEQSECPLSFHHPHIRRVLLTALFLPTPSSSHCQFHCPPYQCSAPDLNISVVTSAFSHLSPIRCPPSGPSLPPSPSVCLSVCLSVSVSVCLSVSLSLSLSVSLSLCLSVSLSLCLSLSLSLSLSVSVSLSLCLSLSLSLSLSCLSPCLSGDTAAWGGDGGKYSYAAQP